MNVSVIIPTLNTKEMTLKCASMICSLAETIIIDNGSNDGTQDEIKRLGLKVMENEKNLGFAKAVNKGARNASNEIICFLNSDALLTLETLEKLVAFLKNNEPCIASADLIGQNSYAKIPNLIDQILPKSLLKKLFPAAFSGLIKRNSDSLEVESLVGACMIMSKKTFDELQGFDEDYFIFLEETDLCLRARKKGVKVFVVSDAHVDHLQGVTKKQFSHRAKVEYTRSLFLFFKKNRGKFEYLLLRLLYPLKSLFTNVILSLLNIVTLFTVKKFREKLSISAWLTAWLFLFCPRGMGINPGTDQSFKS